MMRAPTRRLIRSTELPLQSMNLDASEEFVSGHHDLASVSESFVARFSGMTFIVPPSSNYEEICIPGEMTDREILSEFKPQVSMLGDLFVLLHQPAQWPWSICYIRDKGGELRTISFRREDGEWHV